MQALQKLTTKISDGWHSAKMIVQANTTWNLEVGKGNVEPKRTYRPVPGSPTMYTLENATPHQRALHLPQKFEALGNQKTADHEPYYKNLIPDEMIHPESDPRNIIDLPFAELPPQPIFTVIRFQESVYDENAILRPKSEVEASKKKLLEQQASE